MTRVRSSCFLFFLFQHYVIDNCALSSDSSNAARCLVFCRISSTGTSHPSISHIQRAQRIRRVFIGAKVRPRSECPRRGIRSIRSIYRLYVRINCVCVTRSILTYYPPSSPIPDIRPAVHDGSSKWQDTRERATRPIDESSQRAPISIGLSSPASRFN